MKILEIENFYFSFGETPVLRDISLALAAGDYLSIIGPNGAGKSTLLKCLLRLNDQGRAEGSIRLKGRPLADYAPKKLARAVSYVPQAGGWLPPFTVRELLRLSRYPHASGAGGLTRADRRAVERALEMTGLAGLAERPLKNLSGGERQKAFIAAALAQEAEILLLDEPASFLDPRHAAELGGLLRRLNQEEGLTFMTVTHDLNHPARMGGLALILAAGEARFFGPAREIFAGGRLEAAYNHEFVHLEHPRFGGPAVLAE